MAPRSNPKADLAAGKRENRETRRKTSTKISGRGRRVKRSSSFDRHEKPSLLHELLIGDKIMEERKEESD